MRLGEPARERDERLHVPARAATDEEHVLRVARARVDRRWRGARPLRRERGGHDGDGEQARARRLGRSDDSVAVPVEHEHLASWPAQQVGQRDDRRADGVVRGELIAVHQTEAESEAVDVERVDGAGQLDRFVPHRVARRRVHARLRAHPTRAVDELDHNVRVQPDVVRREVDVGDVGGGVDGHREGELRRRCGRLCPVAP